MSKHVYTERQKQEGKAFLPEYLTRYCGVHNLNANFRCVLPYHKDSSPSMQYNKDTHTVHCHGCSKTWDIYSLVGEREGLSSFPEQLEHVMNLCNMQPEGEYNGSERRLKPRPKQIAPPKPIEGKNLLEAVQEAFNSLYEPEVKHALEYLYSRGFNDRDITRYGWGWCAHPSDIMQGFESHPHNEKGYICLPYPENKAWSSVRYCTFRPLFEYGVKELKPQGMPSSLWHEYELSAGNDEFIYITESVFDAAAAEKLFHHSAISLNGNNKGRLISILANVPRAKRPRLRLFLDSDEAGRKASSALLNELHSIGVQANEVDSFPEGIKDANELLLKAGTND